MLVILFPKYTKFLAAMFSIFGCVWYYPFIFLLRGFQLILLRYLIREKNIFMLNLYFIGDGMFQ